VQRSQYLFPKDIRNLQQLCDGLTFYQRDFNNRPHGDMFGLSPLEVLSAGTLPHKSRFKNQLTVARGKRVVENQLFNCEVCPNPTENDTAI